jgi:DNA repair ATPase RecN
MDAMKLSPTWARAWYWAGLVGLATIAITAVVGWQLISAFSATGERTLDLIVTTLRTTDQTVTTAIDTLSAAEAGMVEAEAALEAAGGGIDRLSAVMQEMAFVLAGEVPGALEAVAASFPAMIDTARVIDRTMNALSFLGISYAPEIPLDESLAAVEDEIVPLAEELRAQAVPLAEATNEIRSVGESVDDVGQRVADITAQLSGSRELVQQYQESATEAGALAADLQDRLGGQIILLRVLLIAMAVTGAVAMTIPMVLGRAALPEIPSE